MDPLANAVLGVLFLATGLAATLWMYRLRGGAVAVSTPRAASPREGAPSPGRSEAPADGDDAPTGGDDAPTSEDEEYLGPWRRPSDELERHMATIHAVAAGGTYATEPLRTREPVVGWDSILLLGAQLARRPLGPDVPVRTETVIGPRAARPMVLGTPIYVTHMSFGALSREAQVAMARGTAAVETAIGSGEGGVLDEAREAAHRYIFEYVPLLYSVTDENLRSADAIEIKIGQSAKPGMGGHLPGGKVTAEIAAVRGRPEGVDIISPPAFEDLRTADDLKRRVDELRERSGGRPIGIKIAAGHLEADLALAVEAGVDFVTIDGRPGGTGAAPKTIKDSTSVPTVFALWRARRFLDEHAPEAISLVATGGLRIGSDFAKALALGADAVAIGTAAMIATGCQQYRICHTGRCPVGVTTQDSELRRRLDVETSARRVANFLRVSTEELRTFARITGRDDVKDLDRSDLGTVSAEIAARTGIPHVGDSPA